MTEPRLRRYACGSTRFRLSLLFKGAPVEPHVFPSSVFLYRHPSGRRVLFDTGYAPTMKGLGWASAIYRRLLPPDVSPEATIDRRLAADGLRPEDIDDVIISHAHPDHIGGIRYFPDATFVISRNQLDALARTDLRSGIIPAVLPDWFDSARLRVLDRDDLSGPAPGGLTGFDLFEDGRFVILDLPGHARGHLGALVEGTVLLAADAAWGRDQLEAFDRMRALPRTISHDFSETQATAQLLLALESSGIRLVFSHDESPSVLLE
ncbi:MBL fold metallo-hydrolase [Microbacterium sp.]|uniref:MBL fold metallo-hydrolase n=1 Tax=Microbacterium sp. TaxID=51671 RepID=UPI003C716294